MVMKNSGTPATNTFLGFLILVLFVFITIKLTAVHYKYPDLLRIADFQMDGKVKDKIAVNFRTVSHHGLFYRSSGVDDSCESVRVKLLDRNVTRLSTEEITANGCIVSDAGRNGIDTIMNDKNFEGTLCQKGKAEFLKDSVQHTGLVSWPGSGNTWVRHLLEYTSGILTGGVYMDHMLKQVFKGERHTEQVLVIKNHDSLGWFKLHFDKVVLLLRKPYESILANYNLRYTSSHTGVLDLSKFNHSAWLKCVHRESLGWSSLYMSWFQFQGPVYILFFDRLVFDFYNEMARLLDFLNVTVTYKTLWCANKNKEGNYHRRKPDWMNRAYLLTAELVELLNKEETTVLNEIYKLYAKNKTFVYTE